MNKNIIVLIISLVVLGSAYAAYMFGSANRSSGNNNSTSSVSPTPVLVGGDSDEHGCKASAGYSWCEVKKKCLRTWEENCSANTSDEIQTLLAEKYGKPVKDVHIALTAQSEFYAGGSVIFGAGGPGEGGMFLARKSDSKWEIVFDGNGNVDCKKMRQEYGFPDSILKPNFCN